MRGNFGQFCSISLKLPRIHVGLRCDEDKNYAQYLDNFVSVLRTRESLFAFFVLVIIRYYKMLTFYNYLHEANSKFQNNRHYGCEAVEVSLHETTSQV